MRTSNREPNYLVVPGLESIPYFNPLQGRGVNWLHFAIQV